MNAIGRRLALALALIGAGFATTAVHSVVRCPSVKVAAAAAHDGPGGAICMTAATAATTW